MTATPILQFAEFSTSLTNRYRVFFPHFLRWLRPPQGALAWLPLGDQHYARSIK
jgi:hypothetical protein